MVEVEVGAGIWQLYCLSLQDKCCILLSVALAALVAGMVEAVLEMPLVVVVQTFAQMQMTCTAGW